MKKPYLVKYKNLSAGSECGNFGEKTALDLLSLDYIPLY